MSFLAKLTLGASEYNILSVEYDISQPIDHHHRPNGKPEGGLIHLVVESNNKTELVEWMLSPNMKKNGSIIFSRRDVSSAMKTIEFKDSFCIFYKETFHASDNNPMKMHLTLSARVLAINNKLLINTWPGMSSDTGESEAPAYSSDDILSGEY